MSDVEQIEHDVRTCELCCPHDAKHEAEVRELARQFANDEPIGLRPDVVVESPHNHSGGVAWK